MAKKPIMKMNQWQRNIGAWGLDTFGKGKDEYVQLLRIQEEAEELVQECKELRLTSDAVAKERLVKDIRKEIADIIIVAMNWGYQNGVDILDDVDDKMLVNYERQWKLRKDGTGEHV